MAAWKKEPITGGRQVDARHNRLEYTREATAQAHTIGAPIVHAAGLASECAADPATVEGFARTAGRSLATADTQDNPKLAYFPVFIGGLYRGNLKEALNTVGNQTAVGLLEESNQWVFSTTPVNKKFKVRKIDSRAALADTYGIIEVEYTG